MVVYVKNADGKNLMPCTSAKARKLLKAQKATVVTYRPFCIQLSWQCEGQTQEGALGIDKGSSVTGMISTGKAQVLFAADIHHRRDVKEKMNDRRDRRKSRRSHLWYRPARFLNRSSSRRSGRLPPSLRTNVEEVIRVAKHIPLPISSIVVEDVQVDIARLNDPTLKGSRYQDPTRLDENLRIATLLTGEIIAPPQSNVYVINFRSRQTRKQFHSLPRKGKGRVRYQVNEELNGFHKGDLVLVKGQCVKRINSIYSNGYLAFPRIKGEPDSARPSQCKLLERVRTILWEVRFANDAQEVS